MIKLMLVLKIVAFVATAAAMLVVTFNFVGNYWQVSSWLWNVAALCLWLREFVLVRLNNG